MCPESESTGHMHTTDASEKNSALKGHIRDRTNNFLKNQEPSEILTFLTNFL
jgi:hypothetical protein